MKYIKLAYILLCCCLLVSIVGAVDLKEGITSDSGTEVNLTAGDITFTTNLDNISVNTATIIDGTKFVPAQTIIDNSNLTWTTGEKDWFIISDPTVAMSYHYSGSSLKETIVLKEDKNLKFPITLDNDSKIIPWYNGQYKIVSATSGDTMTGIIAEKPNGMDASGNVVPMEYTWDGANLNLEYNRTLQVFDSNLTNATNMRDASGFLIPQFDYIGITYPLTIDPTWTSASGCWTYTDGTYNYMMWNTTGTSSWTPPTGIPHVDYLVVGGGGGGGKNRGGGGGAGGYRAGTGLAVSGTETIIVGAGGAGSSTLGVEGTSGGLSSLGTTLTADGGGGGGAGSAGHLNGLNGSSGGGAGSYNNAGAATGGNPTGNGVGFRGGNQAGSANPNNAGSGGGGAGSQGVDGTTDAGTNGGAGLSSNITGFTVWYAGGGGGASFDNPGSAYGVGGSSIGGNGSNYNTVAPTNGAINTGSGGGGASSQYTAGSGGSGIVIIRYLTSGLLPIASFTANTTSGSAPLVVTFNDMSVNGTQWNWAFGDGNVSILQNPTFTYNIVGIYSVNQTVSNVYGNSSLVKTNYITVNRTGYPYAGFTSNVNSGSPGLLVLFVDTSYQGTVNGETYLWDFNDPLSTSPTSSTNGSVTHVYAYAGVYYPTLTITNGAGKNVYPGSAITVSVQQNQQNSWYAPSQVRFTFQNMTGSSLSGILISATPQNMSAPPAWINTFFGVNAGVNLINTTVYGNTASDGAITMPMMQSILYLMTINGTATDGEVVTPFSFYIYPSQSDYLFNIPTTISPGAIQTAPVTNKITYSVGNITYNATAQYYNVTYYDPTGGTSNITYYVNDMNGTALYTQTVTGAGANSVSFSKIVSNPNGGTITTGFYASQSTLGTISDYDAVTFGNFVSLMGIAVPTWVEEWLALGLIILVSCSFSYFSVPVGGVILIGLTGYFVWGTKWLQPIYGYSAMGTGLMILGMWAAIKYIRAREDRLS
jgi:PKD repeat protein